ncbi:MAG: CRTAC1 family protein [Bacteriovoracaceae bacterium]|jgi:hypothetical protein|nr:CRTAC1 family protein [Bacteriovoracaceae bacterium]
MKLKFAMVLVTLLASNSVAVATNHGLKEGIEKLKLIKKQIETPKNISASQLHEFFGGTVKDSKKGISPQVMCHMDEEDFVSIRNQTVFKLENMLKNKDLSELSKIISKNFKINDLRKLSKRGRVNTKDNISEYSWNHSNSSFLKGKNISKSINGYLSQFKKIDDTEIKVIKYLSYKKNRNAKTMRMNDLVMISRFDMRGLDKSGARRNDRSFIQINASKTSEGWKLTQMNFLNGETLVASKPTFKEQSYEVGVSSLPVYTRNEAIRRGGYGLAVGDYNNDGLQDMYVGSWGEGTLLKGTKSGTFIKVSNKESGLQNDTLVKTVVFADFFNTGKQDLLLVRFVPSSKDGKTGSEKFSDIVFYKNLGNGKFEKKQSPIKNRVVASNAMPGAVSDMNGDGFLDFYIGFPGSLDFTFIGDASKIMQGAKTQGLFVNDKTGGFTDTTDTTLYQAHSEGQAIFPHSALSIDYDQDHDMDIIVLDDRGNLSPIYKNIGNGKFVEVADNTGMTNNDLAMGAAGGDLDNDGVLDFAITNVNFVAAERWQESCAANWHVKKMTMGSNGLKLYKGAGQGNFFDTTKISGVSWAGEGMAGVEFIDYNNDGLLDIYVANGLWSGTEKHQDISSVFIRSLVEQKNYLIDEMYFGETESDFMRVLNSFIGDLYGDNKKLKEHPSMAGYQRNRLFRNNGNNQFTEVGYLEGVDSIADGYIIAKADLNNDGKMDLILRNGDPGIIQVKYPAVQVYLNNSKAKNNSLLVELEGKKSNRDAIGSFVEIELKNKKILTHLVANNGTAQSQKVLHFGLGKESLAKKLTVTWPDGQKTILKNIKKGTLKIIEGQAGGFASK